MLDSVYTKVDELGPGLSVVSDPESATGEEQPGHERRGRFKVLIRF